MSHICVVINGNNVFDGGLDEWENRPPDMFKDAVKQGAKPKPWLKAVMIAMADALMQNQSLNIDVTHRSNRWQMKVEGVT
jgi:hypothetical protein